jgi:glycosyltransferase involved in cell wall biosynthesis
MTALNVLQLGAFPFPSHQGSQVYVAGMARGLAWAGCTVHLAAYGHGEGAWPEGVRQVEVPRLPIGTLASGPHWSKPVLDAVLVAAVARSLRRGVQIVHAHNVEAPLVAWAAMRLAGRRVPLVYNLHTSLEEELPVYGGAGLQARAAARFGRQIDRLLPRLADACVAISPRAEARLREWGATTVEHVPPAVDMAELRGGDAARARRRWALGDGPWVVYCGNTDPYQDLPVLYAAMARLPEVGLLVVTGAPAEAVRAEAIGHGVAPARLRVVHSRLFGDTLDALAVASAAALPRATCSGFPIKLLNTLGCGVPTVVAAGSAQPLEGVVVVPDHDPLAMAGALRDLVDDPAMARRLGDGGRRAVSSRHAWSSSSKRLISLYEALISRQAGSSGA